MAGKKFKTDIQPVFADLMQKDQPQAAEYDAKNTQGKRGMKADRMNMAFSHENFEYMRTMAGLHKMTMTKYINRLIEEDRKRNLELYEKAKSLMEDL